MMKSITTKIALIAFLAFLSFGFVSLKENKAACAAVCPYCLGCETDWYSVAMQQVQWAIDNIKTWFENAMYMIKDFFQTKIKSMFKQENMMKIISQQERLADTKVIEQKTMIKEALAMIKKTTVFQRNQVDTLARRFPAASDEVCKDTTSRIRMSEMDRYANFERQVLRERDRVRNGVTVRTGAAGGGGGGGGNSGFASTNIYGQVVRNRALYDAGVGSLCYTDSDLGHHQGNPQGCNVPPSSSDLRAEWPRSPSLLLGPITEDKNNTGMRLMQELIMPPIESQRFPKSIANDKTLQDTYMNTVRIEAAQDLDEEIIRNFVSQITTNDSWSGSITSCAQNMEFVKEVVSRKYGLRDARPGGATRCPSAAEMKWAEVMSTVNTGYIASSGTAMDGNMYQAQLNAVTLDHKLAFEEIDSYRTMLLQRAIASTMSRIGAGKDNTPVGAEGR